MTEIARPAIPGLRYTPSLPKIVVVDDNEYLTELLDARFRNERWVIVRFAEGLSAKRHFARHVSDLLLLDIQLPDMSGLDLLRDLKADRFTAQMPVIMLTGQTAPSDVQRAKELGALGYIAKPFVMERVVTQVRRALRVEEQILL